MATLDEYLAEHPEAAPKRKVRHPEWTLQTRLVGFVREFVACEHEFVAHDRSFDATGKQHLFEAERGIRRAWPDTELLCAGGLTFRCELKWPPNQVRRGDEQDRLLTRMNILGHPSEWANSIESYMARASESGVLFRPGALQRARYLDEWLRATFAKPSSAKPKRASRPRREQASQRALKVARGFHTK